VIRRAALFLLLLGAGFGVLHLLTRQEHGAGAASQPLPPSSTGQPRGIVVPSHQGDGTAGEVAVSLSGRLVLPRHREVVLPDGRRTELLSYRIEAQDSRPLEDDVYELTGLRVKFYEVGGPPAAPAAVPAGELEAATGFLKVGRDSKGRPSVREDRDMDLRGVRFTTGAGSRVEHLTLELQQLFARHDEQELHLRTAHIEEPFVLTIAGEPRIALTGKGLDAHFPNRRSESQTGGIVQISVGSDPVLVQRSADRESRLQARGPLHYREDLAAGVATVATRDAVRLEGVLGSGDRAVACGDDVVGTLRRDRQADAGKPGATWEAVRLRGEPCTLTGDRQELSCAQLDVTPSGGEPYLFTASGAPRLRARQADGSALEVHARRIHLLRLQAWLQPYFAAYRWQPWQLGTLPTQVVLFEGPTRFQLGASRGEAATGLVVLRGEHEAAPTTLRGFGRFTSRGEQDLVVRGDDGFLLYRAGDETMSLSPRGVPVAFEVEQAGTKLTGTGRCILRRGAATTLEVRSPPGDVTITRAGGGELREVKTLDAALRAGQLEQLVATGSPCRLTFPTADAVLRGSAARIRSDDPRQVVLHGAPATLWRESGELVEGATLELTQWEQGLALVADGDSHLVVLQPDELGRPTRLELFATRSTLLPYLLPEAAVVWHHRLHARSLWPFCAASLRRPRLHATGSVSVVRHDAAGKELAHARGDELWLQTDGPAGWIRGDPATVLHVDQSGKPNRGSSNQILFWHEAEGDYVTLRKTAGRLPSLDLAAPEQSPPRGPSGQRLQVTCDGDIAAEPARVKFLGASSARTLDPGGRVDPRGLTVDAGTMWLERDRKTGAATELLATPDAQLSWNDVRAAGERLALDLVRNQLILEDGKGAAGIETSSFAWRGKAIQFDYLTYEFEAWASSIQRTSVVKGR
jgi:hypothetical protein